MVLHHFNLREQPFGVTPDPRYLYPGPAHSEALSSVLYGVQSGLGFMVLTARPGMGKTTIIHEALRKIRDEKETVFLFQRIGSALELIRAILIDVGVEDTQGSLLELQSKLNTFLVETSASGKSLVVIIDEAQDLDDSVLEFLRMLSNFETASAKLMQIILSGQPQLGDKLKSDRLLQLRQRVSIFAHLDALSSDEVKSYVQHRLSVAGLNAKAQLFTDSALELIARFSEGIPRNINNICLNALSIGCALGRHSIDADVVLEVVADLGISYPDLRSAVVLSSATRALKEPATIGTTLVRYSSTARALKEPATINTGHVRYSINRRGLSVGVLCIILLSLISMALGYQASLTTTAVEATSYMENQATAKIIAPTAPPPRVTQMASAQPPWIEVRDGQSLYSICVQIHRTCDAKDLQQFTKINPSLGNPRHIRPGSKVNIPVFSNGPNDDAGAPRDSEGGQH